MDFWDAVKAEIKNQNTTQRWVAEKAGIDPGYFRQMISRGIQPKADQARAIATALGVSTDYMLTGESAPIYGVNPMQQAVSIFKGGMPDNLGFDGGVMVALLNQKVSAGSGQMLVDGEDIISLVPLPSRIARRFPGFRIAAMEVRGDSMTRVYIFDGDIVYFAHGLVRDDGIYVIDVNGERLVKRLQFDYIERKIQIYSENDRYPDCKILPMDSEIFTIVGKVVFTLHVHPY